MLQPPCALTVPSQGWVDCWAENFSLDYDVTRRRAVQPRGVEVRVPHWGSPECCSTLDPQFPAATRYMATLVDALRAAGLSGEGAVLAAPYDHRLAPDSLAADGYFRNLTRLVRSQAHNVSVKYWKVHDASSPIYS